MAVSHATVGTLVEFFGQTLLGNLAQRVKGQPLILETAGLDFFLYSIKRADDSL